MTKYTNLEIAGNFSLWQEYADPSGEDTLETFQARTLEENLAILEACGFTDEKE